MKTISILGATGSIGTQTLSVVRRYPDEFRVAAITGNRNIDCLEEEAREFSPKLVALPDEKAAGELALRLRDTDIKVVSGEEGLIEAVTLPETDIVVTAVVGFAGLIPTLAAIDAGKDIALANKETLVTAGDTVMRRAMEAGVRILPVDSEHSAIFQSLMGQSGAIRRILLTASGGPFFGKTREELKCVTAKDALRHPNWSMGNKITIDSATLMNKGLEVIEAVRLFGVTADQVSVVVHRESILHSAVEFCDHSVIAQMGIPDMCLPISFALHYPERGGAVSRPLELTELGTLSFFPPDTDTFRALPLAIEAVKTGGTAPTVLNAANEVMVDAFLRHQCGFLEITEGVEHALRSLPIQPDPDVSEIMECDLYVRTWLRKELHC